MQRLFRITWERYQDRGGVKDRFLSFNIQPGHNERAVRQIALRDQVPGRQLVDVKEILLYMP